MTASILRPDQEHCMRAGYQVFCYLNTIVCLLDFYSDSAVLSTFMSLAFSYQPGSKASVSSRKRMFSVGNTRFSDRKQQFLGDCVPETCFQTVTLVFAGLWSTAGRKPGRFRTVAARKRVFPGVFCPETPAPRAQQARHACFRLLTTRKRPKTPVSRA